MGEKQGHTPGPWTFEADTIQGDWIITTNHEDEDARSVVEVCNADEADIRLIAAAPDLLAVAIKSHEPYVGLDEEDIRCLYGADEADLAMALRDAISRATGEDSPANEGEA